MTLVSRKMTIKVLYWNAVAAILIVSLGAVTVVRHIHQYDTLIVEIGDSHEVDPRLISSIIWKESRYQAGQSGTSGEIGLMQVTPSIAYEWAAEEGIERFVKHDLFDPETNIRAGT